MDGSVIQTYLADILHAVSQALLAPDIILLLAFIVYALFCIGSVVAEYFTERRHFTIVMPRFLADLMSADESSIPDVIKKSGLLRRQKIALLTVYDYRTLPGDALVALIRRLVNEEESRYDRIAGRNNMAARVSPMLGLMGTLIPLGPGIQALGKADTAALSSSLLVAFDTTVAGLVVAAVCLVVGKIRQNWYGNYMNALDSGMATMLQKIEDMRAAGKITIEEPSDYAFLFESGGAKPAEKKAEGDRRPAKKDAPRKDDTARKESAARKEDASRKTDAPRISEPKAARQADEKRSVEAAPSVVAAPLASTERTSQATTAPAIADVAQAVEPTVAPGLGWLPTEVNTLPYDIGATTSFDPAAMPAYGTDFKSQASPMPYYDPTAANPQAAGSMYQMPLGQGGVPADSSRQMPGGWYQPQAHQGATTMSPYGADGRASWGARRTTQSGEASPNEGSQG